MDQQDLTPPAASPALHTWDVLVTGHVQGVGYRYFAQRAAQAMGVAGWVRNESSGQVRALLQHADVSTLSRMVVALKHGPPHGWVQDCEVTLLDAADRYSDFIIRS
jgi:acylphosphatase